MWTVVKCFSFYYSLLLKKKKKRFNIRLDISKIKSEINFVTNIPDLS